MVAMIPTGYGLGYSQTLALFWTITKKFKLFPGGAAPPQTPPSSRLLSQPPQARFERLSQVGRCRGLQGCAMAKGCCDFVNGLECTLENSQVISNQAKFWPRPDF